MKQNLVRYSPDVERADPNFEQSFQSVVGGVKRYVEGSGVICRSRRMAVTKSFVPGAPNPAGCPGAEGNWSPESADLSVDIARGVSGDPDQPVRVTLTYRFRAVTPIIGSIIGDPLMLTAASRMYVEK